MKNKIQPKSTNDIRILRIGLFTIFIFISLLLWLGPVLALEIDYPRIPGTDPPQVFLQKIERGEIPSEQIPSLYAKYIFNLAIWLTGIIALAVLIIGGLRYLLSAGKSETITAARDQILAGGLGILILLSSFIVLNILNPQLLILKIPPIKQIKIETSSPVPEPSLRLIGTSIDVELPFGRIIEGRIFETYVSMDEKRKPRMTRITNIAEDTLKTSEKLISQNEELNKLVTPDNCKCSNAKAQCSPCVSGRSCTSDPCNYVRGGIENIEQKNKEKIDELLDQQKKAGEEIKDLETELNRLKRAERFIKEQSFFLLNSFAEFLTIKDFLQTKEGIVREIRFWDDMIIPYLNKKEKWGSDWASFLGTVGGKILTTGGPPYGLGEEEIKAGEEPKACSAEAVVGEIIDRTLKTGSLLVKRLEKLVELNKEIIKAVDEMHIWVSQCTSQNPSCSSVCIKTKYSCIKRCVGTPCPFEEISKQTQKIKEILERKEGIKDVVQAPKPQEREKKEEIGIITIIEKVAPKILEDLAKEVRYPMQVCEPKKYKEVLNRCPMVIDRRGPDGKIIKICCMEEPIYQECLQECYLEEGQKKYRKCLQECLEKKYNEAKQKEEPAAEDILACRHRLNFFCCTP